MTNVNRSVILISEDIETIKVFREIAEDNHINFLCDKHYTEESHDHDSPLLIVDMESAFYNSVIFESGGESGHRLIVLARRNDRKLFDYIKKIKPSGLILKPVDAVYAYAAIETACERLSEINIIKNDLIEARILSNSASEAKTRFMATISLEIRTPMNAIIGMTDLALLTNDSEEILDYLIDLKTASGKLLNLTNKILDFSKVETGEMKIEPAVFSLKHLVDSAMNRFQEQADEKQLEFTSSISPGIDDCYYGDPGRIGQILQHIISNAIKFTESGHVRIAVSSDTGNSPVENGMSLITFIVTDNGIGISPDKQMIIFEKFRQVEDSRTRSWGGTGLGLAISKSLTELMNGSIGVDSTPGCGSRFYFSIPLRVETALDKVTCETPAKYFHDGRVLQILLVEDNPVNARLAEVILKRLGHNVSAAKNGMIALEMLRESCYDLIFMDVEMPVMDGIETTRNIRSGSAGEDKKNIPIVAITAYALAEYENECIDSGMNYFITKPINVTLIPDILNRIKSNCS